MNGIPATIAIRQLMATPTTSTSRHPRPAPLAPTHSRTVRVVAPLLALALFVALVSVLALGQSGSDDSTPQAACRIRTTAWQHTCR